MPVCSEQALFLKEDKKIYSLGLGLCIIMFHNFVRTETKVIGCFSFMKIKSNHLYFVEENSCQKKVLIIYHFGFLCRTLSSTLAISKAKQVRGGMEV